MKRNSPLAIARLKIKTLEEKHRQGYPRKPVTADEFGARESRRSVVIKAKELDKQFDDGEDVSAYFDLTNVRRPGLEQKRVNVDFPVRMIQSLDKEASRLGVPRQSLIKVLIAQHFDKARA